MRYVLLGAVLLSSAVCVLGGTHSAGLKWLDENAKKDGVVKLPSGLQYKVVRKGTGTDHPTASSSCECHYEGTLIDGTKFDSSYDRGSPTSFAPNQVIKGWTEAMQLMVEGDLWELYIPSELGYGDSGSGAKIKGGDPLVFKIEIIKIKGGRTPAIRCDPTTTEGCNEQEKTYIDKVVRSFSPSDRTTELARLKKMDTASATKGMKPDVLSWLRRRITILEKLGAAEAKAAEL